MATTFHHFPLLSIEIRLQIWSFAQCPQILRIHVEPDSRILNGYRPLTALTNLAAYESRFERPFYFKCLSPPPAILHVNREARREGLKNYAVMREDSGRRFYFDNRKDTLWVERSDYPDDWVMLVKCLSEVGILVRSLAIWDDGNHGLYQPNFAQKIMEGGIEKLFLVFEAKGEMIPGVWSLVPRCEVVESVDTSLHMAGVGHRFVARQFKKMDERDEGGSIPRVTLMHREFWEKEGLQLVEKTSQEGVMCRES